MDSELVMALRADLRRCLDDVATEFRARGRDDTRFVQLIARMDALAAHDAREGERAEPGATKLMLDDLPESVRVAFDEIDDCMRMDIKVNPVGALNVLRAELLRLASRVKELERENAELRKYVTEADRRVGEQFNAARQAQAFALAKQQECLSATTELAALKARIAEAPKGTVKWATPVSLAMDCESDAIPMYGRRVVLLDMGKEG